MPESSLDTLTRRLDRLEREISWWKLLGGGTVSILMVLASLGATSAVKVQEEVRAKRFVLMDRGGRERAQLEIRELTHLGSKGDATVLRLTDADDKASVSLTAGPSDMVSLALTDVREKPRAIIGIASDNVVAFSLSDSQGRPRVGISSSDGRPTGLRLNDIFEKARAELVVLPDGRAAFGMYDEDGKVIWRAP